MSLQLRVKQCSVILTHPKVDCSVRNTCNLLKIACGEGDASERTVFHWMQMNESGRENVFDKNILVGLEILPRLAGLSFESWMLQCGKCSFCRNYIKQDIFKHQKSMQQ